MTGAEESETQQAREEAYATLLDILMSLEACPTGFTLEELLGESNEGFDRYRARTHMLEQELVRRKEILAEAESRIAALTERLATATS